MEEIENEEQPVTRSLATDAVNTAVLAGAAYYGVEGAKKLKEVVAGKKDEPKED